MKNLMFILMALLISVGCGIKKDGMTAKSQKPVNTPLSESPNHLRYFGEIDLNKTPFDDDVAIVVNKDDVLIDLRFSSRTTTTEKLQPAASFLNNLEAMETKAREAIATELDEGRKMKTFFATHIMNFTDEQFELIGMPPDDPPKNHIPKLLSNLNLWRIAVSPDGDETVSIFHYSFVDRELSDRLVYVHLDAEGEVKKLHAD